MRNVSQATLEALVLGCVEINHLLLPASALATAKYCKAKRLELKSTFLVFSALHEDPAECCEAIGLM
jgi:hypothetical protein